MTHFLPARIEWEGREARVTQLPWQGSGDIVALALANGFLVVGPDRPEMAVGEWVDVLPRRGGLDIGHGMPCPHNAQKRMAKLTHFRRRGEVAMVDVTAKAVTERTAVARGFVRMSSAVLRALRQQKLPKGTPGNCTNCRNCGCETHGRLDTSLSPAVADAH